MKKILFGLILVCLIGGLSYYWYLSTNTDNIKKATSFEFNQSFNNSNLNESVVKESSTQNEKVNIALTLTQMLESGINTYHGVLVSVKQPNNTYRLTLNHKNLTEIKAYSMINLEKLFNINNQQILLINYSLGGNNCAGQYQFITITDKSYKVSTAFGNCLIAKQIIQIDDKINISMPNNSPYTSDEDLITYQFENDKIKLLSKPNRKYYKDKYATISAEQILAIANKDGCYTQGIILDSNACGSGIKYCLMFRNMKNFIKDDNYKILKEFCS